MSKKGHYLVDITLFVEASSTREAYERIREKMGSLDEESFSWESTNNWIDPAGEVLELGEINDAILAVLAAEDGTDDEETE